MPRLASVLLVLLVLSSAVSAQQMSAQISLTVVDDRGEPLLKSVTLGGADATDTPFDFGVAGRSYTDAVVVLSDKGASVGGRVVDTRGEPLADELVKVFSASRDRWYYDPRHVRSVRSGRDGAFQINALAPGDYYIALMSPADTAQSEGGASDPDVLESVVPRAERVTVGEAPRVTVTVRRPSQ